MHDVTYAMHVNIIMFIYRVCTHINIIHLSIFSTIMCMNVIKKLYKHDNINMHMRNHADFESPYFNVRICTDFLNFGVRT